VREEEETMCVRKRRPLCLAGPFAVVINIQVDQIRLPRSFRAFNVALALLYDMGKGAW